MKIILGETISAASARPTTATGSRVRSSKPMLRPGARVSTRSISNASMQTTIRDGVNAVHHTRWYFDTAVLIPCTEKPLEKEIVQIDLAVTFINCSSDMASFAPLPALKSLALSDTGDSSLQ